MNVIFFITLSRQSINERVISRAINRALYDGNILEPVDIIAMDSRKWEKNKNNKFMIYSDINTREITDRLMKMNITMQSGFQNTFTTGL